MDTKNLKLFLNLAESLHFGRASEMSHLSVSALSRNIMQLEDSLGVKLFERNNRSVTLTKAGKDFIHYADETINQWDIIRASLQENSHTLSGELSVYCSVTASYSFLYDILRNFRIKYPQIEIKLHTGDSEHALTKTLSGTEDITMGALPEKLPQGVVFQSIASSELLFIAPKENSALVYLANEQRPEQMRKNWQQIPMILSEQGIARKMANDWFSNIEVAPKIYAQVAGNEAIVTMVSLGFGIGIVPKIVLMNSPLRDTVSIVTPPQKLPDFNIGLFTLEKKLKNPLVQAFWQL
ncbi:MAG: HTH-type transcriptional activator IlvY [Oceanospirillaceae bacterium]|nr:HTH-type transcriptional activator IlvY [Oceanospirillaceae bacterium]